MPPATEEGEDEGEASRLSARSRASSRSSRSLTCATTIRASSAATTSQRDQQPREHHREREHRPQPQYQPQPQPQPVIADTGGVDRLPSFITGPQPQVNGGEATMKGAVAANVSRAGDAGRMARVPRAWPRLPARRRFQSGE